MIVINSFCDPNAPKGFYLWHYPYSTLQSFLDYERVMYVGEKNGQYEHDKWALNASEVVRQGVHMVVAYNEDLEKALLETGDKQLVYAGDSILGCGLLEADPNIFDKTKWTGFNILGSMYMELRSELIDGTFKRSRYIRDGMTKKTVVSRAIRLPEITLTHYKKDGMVDYYETRINRYGNPVPEIKITKVQREAVYIVYNDDDSVERVVYHRYIEGKDEPMIEVIKGTSSVMDEVD